MRSAVVASLVYLALISAGCSRDRVATQKKLEPAFYYWKSSFALDSVERQALASSHCKKLYIKCFDVVWDASQHGASPVAEIRWRDSLPAGVEFVPVIFLTEPSLAQTAPNEIATLAHDCIDELQSLVPHTFNEVQFDCDWSDRSRNNYFAFLNDCRAQLPRSTIVSATIRLHQVKYRERTGVPPIDRGMLMYYNMSDWRDVHTKNSIFDADVAERYIDYIHDYPLALDLALPIFHWAIVYRNGHVIGIQNNCGVSELRRCSAFDDRGDGKFVMRRDTVMDRLPMKTGDVLRTESVPLDALRDAEGRVLARIAQSELTLSLFSLDDASIRQYERSSLDSLWKATP